MISTILLICWLVFCAVMGILTGYGLTDRYFKAHARRKEAKRLKPFRVFQKNERGEIMVWNRYDSEGQAVEAAKALDSAYGNGQDWYYDANSPDYSDPEYLDHYFGYYPDTYERKLKVKR